MNISFEIIKSLSEFKACTRYWAWEISADVETYDKKTPQDTLLGVSLSAAQTGKGPQALYIPVSQYNKDTKQFDYLLTEDLASYLCGWLVSKQLVGHNYTYDKGWLDRTFKINTRWKADTRIMWHLSAAPSGPRPYGLKDAQKEVLGWETRGDEELSANVKQHGGRLKSGDHYLADLSVLAKYAALDAYSTIQLYANLVPFFDGYDYWWMLDRMMAYAELLQNNTHHGILVDVDGLQKAHHRLDRLKEAAKKRIYKELKNEIESLEKDWADRRIAKYKREYNKTYYAAHPEEWERFNFNSDSHKRELFFDKLRQEPSALTPTGKACVDGDSIRRISLPFVAPYLKYENANTLTSNFTGPYLSSVRSGRLHPGFNICGTVSYRLSGFKPYLLNAPFDERQIMKHFKCDDGFGGVHADLAAVEPCLTAHYSEDPSLLRVFGKGLGDIYLDLALSMFPEDRELQEGYNQQLPITNAIKERFNKQRKVAKIVQLAVQYTGTEFTVAKSLTSAGIPTTPEQAKQYVTGYWKKFHAVKVFNYRIKALYREQGYLRNVAGRLIRIPKTWPWDHKDLPNRFIQSSGHDVLILWVLEIYRRCSVEGIDIRPILLDCHDSTSNQVPHDQVARTRQIYGEALDAVNESLGLCVKVKAEVKTFSTLAGLKGKED